MAAKTSKIVKKEDHISPDENIALELGHIIWYIETGSKIEDVDEMEKSWNEEYPDMKGFADSIVEHMFSRGMTISYFDRDMSHFGKI